MARFVIFLFLIIVLYKLLRGLVKNLGTSDRPEVPPGERTEELVKDPQCGAYILPAQGEPARVGNKLYHFCSERCKDQFFEKHSE
jgi:YHS domain-containing protein